MNVLFVDIDGVLNSTGYSEGIVDRMVQVLSEMCKIYNTKVVIESTHKPIKSGFEEESELIKDLYSSFEKYNIELIGFTPSVEIHEGISYISAWKDYEILYYLLNHPEIEHFAIIDDNDFIDLLLLNEYLVETKAYSPNKEEEGLLPKHIEEVGKVLKLENKYKDLRKNKFK